MAHSAEGKYIQWRQSDSSMGLQRIQTTVLARNYPAKLTQQCPAGSSDIERNGFSGVTDTP